MPRWSIWPLIGIYFILANLYSAATPYRQPGVLMNQRLAGKPIPVPDVGAPDERQHANYIVHLKEYWKFPVLVPGSPDLGETYQSHQPPLYYLLATGWSLVTGSNPYTSPGGIGLRLLSILIGAGTMLGMFYAAIWGFRGLRYDPVSIGFAAASAGGLMPMFLALNSAVSNDPLLILLFTWTLALTLRSIRDGWTVKRTLVIGVFMGLAMLTKTTALALIPMVITAIVLSPMPAPESPSQFNPKVRALALAILPAILIALPWWMRNQSLYGDPLAMKAFAAAFVGSPKSADLIQGMGAGRYWTDMFGWWSLRSFFGAFGYMDIFLPDLLYRALAVIFGVLGVGWVLAVRDKKGQEPDKGFRAVHLTCGMLLVVVLVLYLQFNLTYFQAQARYIYPAIAPIALGFGLGSMRLAGKWGSFVPGVLLLGLNIYVLSMLGGEFATRLGP